VLDLDRFWAEGWRIGIGVALWLAFGLGFLLGRG
jgi:hypothetical protein